MLLIFVVAVTIVAVWLPCITTQNDQNWQAGGADSRHGGQGMKRRFNQRHGNRRVILVAMKDKSLWDSCRRLLLRVCSGLEAAIWKREEDKMPVGNSLNWDGTVPASMTPAFVGLTVSYKRGTGNPAKSFEVRAGLTTDATGNDVAGIIFREWQKEHPYAHDIELETQGNGARIYFTRTPYAIDIRSYDGAGQELSFDPLQLGGRVIIRGIGISSWNQTPPSP